MRKLLITLVLSLLVSNIYAHIPEGVNPETFVVQECQLTGATLMRAAELRDEGVSYRKNVKRLKKWIKKHPEFPSLVDMEVIYRLIKMVHKDPDFTPHSPEIIGRAVFAGCVAAHGYRLGGAGLESHSGEDNGYQERDDGLENRDSRGWSI
jgi:hypothetical protein